MKSWRVDGSMMIDLYSHEWFTKPWLMSGSLLVILWFFLVPPGSTASFDGAPGDARGLLHFKPGDLGVFDDVARRPGQNDLGKSSK